MARKTLWITAAAILFILVFNYGGDKPRAFIEDLMGRTPSASLVSDGTLLDGTLYHYSTQGDKHRFVFDPHLARDETVVIEAIVELIGAAFGPLQIHDITPRRTSRGAANLFVYDGGPRWFVAQIQRTADTRRVFSITLWDEPK